MKTITTVHSENVLKVKQVGIFKAMTTDLVFKRSELLLFWGSQGII
jgi:hypothetical protein